ncbi:MAG: hypothetical protein AAFN40_13920 [Cyanobacteria bacterium J06560_6]
MKILVGVMYCIENEFLECIQSIQNQSYKDFEYFVLENLSNKDAHEQLYQTFMREAESYDLFVKVDADMVIARDSFFQEVVNYFSTFSDVDDLQIAVHDFFTDRLVYGLHVYSRRMKWEEDKEQIFVDWPERKNMPIKRVNDRANLAPAAFHCPNPSRFQAFHFGVHKAVKIMQHECQDFRYYASIVHWDNLICLKNNFLSDRDILLAFSILGAWESLVSKFASSEINFDSTKVKNAFQKWNSLPVRKIVEKAQKVSFILSVFPDSLLLELVILRRNMPFGMKYSVISFLKNMKRRKLSRYREKMIEAHS